MDALSNDIALAGFYLVYALRLNLIYGQRSFPCPNGRIRAAKNR